MTRTPDPRYITNVRLVIQLDARDATEAEARLVAVLNFIAERVQRSTFERLPGQPALLLADVISEVVPSPS